MRIPAFGIELDVMPLDTAVAQISQWLSDQPRLGRYVVTPNVDHVLTLKSNEAFRQAYTDASLRLIDGWPVAKAVSWLANVHATTVPGSDLVPAIFSHLTSTGKTAGVFLLGALPGVAEIAASSIEARWNGISVVGTYSPPFGFERDAAECKKICDMLLEAKPDILVIGLGAPKQEIWIHRYKDQIGPCVSICAGATIDFLAGSKKRAPRWVRTLRFEWLYRMLQEPKRLFLRYAKGMILFPAYLVQEKLSRK